jgi:xylulokinase
VAAHDDLVLAIDLGTSAVKVILFDLDGRIVASVEQDTPLRHPRPTWIESDAEIWWQTAAAGVRAVLAESSDHAEAIRAIGVCGFMHTLVPIDSAGQALCPPMLWPDQRCAAEAADLSAHADTFRRITGRPVTTMSSVPRLRWLGAHYPDAIARARAFLLSKDFLRYRLTGEISTDHYDANGTGLVDRRTGAWSDELLDLAGVRPNQMPPIRESEDLAGKVTPYAAAATGLRQGTPVVVGSGDWPSTIIASGCYLPDRVCLYLGTAGIIGAFTSAEEQARFGKQAYFGSVTATGSALRWTRELFDDSTPRLTYPSIADEAETSEPGARGVLFLPHLMGERGGTMRPAARGAFFGLTLAHRRADLFRAVLEGTALWLRATTEPYLAKQPIGDFLLLGGGARGRLWRQIVAAIYRRRLLVPEVVEGGALGVAMIAAVGTGLQPDYRRTAAEWIRIARVEEPDPALVARYEEIYRDFIRVESVVRQLEDHFF